LYIVFLYIAIFNFDFLTAGAVDTVVFYLRLYISNALFLISLYLCTAGG